MFRTFIVGIVLGIAMAAALVIFFPVVDQHRERSLVSVHPNGGNSESFPIRLPDDRIMAGVAGTSTSTPPGLDWPQQAFLANFQSELFKVRNEDGVDWVEETYRENYQRLREIKKKYDPMNLFRLNANILPAA